MKRMKRIPNRWVLVLCLLHALVIPAYGTHNHAEAAGCQIQPHSHEERCLDDNGRIICGYGDCFIHGHDGNCYDSSGNLLCTLPEIHTHIHGERCYSAREMTSGDREILWKQVLVCTIPEIQHHIHQEHCFQDGKWVCGQLEILPHSHDASCFSTNTTTNRDWIGAIEPNGFTVVGLVQIVMGLGLLYLQTLFGQKETAMSLPSFYKES